MPAPADPAEAAAVHTDHRARGIALRIGSVSTFGVAIAALKYASQHGVTPAELIFYRNLFAMPAILIWLLMTTGMAGVRTRRPGAHAMRAVIGLVAMYLNFMALSLLPLAEATAIGFSSPLFATALSAVLLREQVGWHRWAAIGLGFIGVLVVVQPGGGSLPLVGVAVGLAAAFGVALVVVTLRQIGETERAAATVFWFTLASLIVTAVPMLWLFQWHAGPVWIALAILGLFGGIAQIMITASVRFAPVSVLAPIDYLQMVWAILWGWLLFLVAPTANALIGAALIAAGGGYIVWREGRRNRPVVPSASEL